MTHYMVRKQRERGILGQTWKRGGGGGGILKIGESVKR